MMREDAGLSLSIKIECSLLLRRGLSLGVNWESGVLVSQVGVAG